MCSYISSNDNRIYAMAESAYGSVPAVATAGRIPAVKLAVKETYERPARRDKTGSRTYAGLPTGMRKQTAYELTTYMTGWSDTSSQPGSSCLFEAGMGAAPLAFQGATVASADSTGTLVFSGGHGLIAGQSVVVNGEMRFVTAVIDNVTVNVNAPFTMTLPAGSLATATLTYQLARSLPSISLFDYWSPSEAVQRVVSGAAVDEIKIAVNGDFHQFTFRGPAKTAIDSTSFSAGEGGLQEFPAEPSDTAFDYSIVPGHLGQVWLGATPNRFYTLTDADIRIQNAIETRSREFGMEGPCRIVAGQRTVTVNFDLFAGSDSASTELFQAARQRSPISAMLQLGQQTGQLFGAYMKSVVPETPAFDDSETRLQWRFSECRAQGTSDDEIVIGIG